MAYANIISCIKHTNVRNSIIQLTAPPYSSFLRQSTCYVITPHIHQWYKINANEIRENHKLALCDDQSAHMVPLPPAEMPPINAFMTIRRLTLLQAQDGKISDNHKQPMYNNIPLVNQNMECSHQSQDVYPYNQSTIILQQFSIITQDHEISWTKCLLIYTKSLKHALQHKKTPAS